MSDDGIPVPTQEGLLVLLCHDDDAAVSIRASVSSDLFEGRYREIAERVYEYIIEHKKAPGDHLADLLHDRLYAADQRQRQAWRNLLMHLSDSKERVNKDFVLTRLKEFVRRQSLRSGVLQAAEILQQPSADLAEVERVLRESSSGRYLDVFDVGLRFSDFERSVNFLRDPNPALKLGIPELDRRNLGPRRKEMHFLLGPRKRGKSHWLHHVGKCALMQHLKVLHASFENAEDVASARYYQTFFAAARREDRNRQVFFERDRDTKILKGIRVEDVHPEINFRDDDVEAALRARRDALGHIRWDDLIIRKFPTGKVTLAEFEAYLDRLERVEHFVPDVIIVDYPALMRIPGRSDRWERLGEMVVQLRGVFDERNAYGAVVGQLNQKGTIAARKGTATSENAGEAFSQAATADTIFTLNQTPEEYKLGLSRIYVDGARNEQDRFEVVLAQNLATSQFCLDSAMLTSDYWPSVEEYAPKRKRDSDDGDDQDHKD